MTNDITLSTAAAKRIKYLQSIEQDPLIKLRIYITGGGCSGFQYGFTFDNQVKEDDTVVDCVIEDEKGGASSVALLIDPLSYTYLVGAEVDFVEGLYGAHFKVNNPNAKSTCGCGASFSL